MKKILLGALVCAAVAGVVYYLYDPETFNETVGDLKDKANDMYGKAKDIVGKQADKAKDMIGKQADKAMSGAMS